MEWRETILTDDDGWLITVSGFDPLRERGAESLLTVANGLVGTRGSLEEGHRASLPATFVAGVFDPIRSVPDPPETLDESPALVIVPNWLSLSLMVDGETLSLEAGEVLEHARELDMRQALHAHHSASAVAYGVWQYWQATADDEFFRTAGAEILLETARFWASRAQLEPDGRYHIRDVIGPDEYHERVDDSAYTNWMARWNLEAGRAAAAWLARSDATHWRTLRKRLELTEDELAAWDVVAEGLADGYDAATGLIEQFAGYFALEDLDLPAWEPRAAAMQTVLGRERVGRTRIIKQADIVLLCSLLWDRLRGVAAKNLAYYEPRCDHASSLSPGIHALVASRLGQLDLARLRRPGRGDRPRGHDGQCGAGGARRGGRGPLAGGCVRCGGDATAR